MLSIVYINKNRNQFLIRSLISLLDQLEKIDNFDWEIVIVSGSEFNVLEQPSAIADYHRSIHVIRLDSKVDFCASAYRNLGAHNAKGEVLLFLDNDLLLDEGFADEVRRSLPSVVAKNQVFLGIRSYLKKGIHRHPCSDHEIGYPDERIGLFGQDLTNLSQSPGGWHFFFSHTVLMPKALFEEVGEFDTNFIGWGLEDCELGFRIYQNGNSIYLNPAMHSYHLDHAGPNMQIRDEGWLKNFRYFADKHHDLEVSAQAVLYSYFSLESREKFSQGLQNDMWSIAIESFISLVTRLKSADRDFT